VAHQPPLARKRVEQTTLQIADAESSVQLCSALGNTLLKHGRNSVCETLDIVVRENGHDDSRLSDMLVLTNNRVASSAACLGQAASAMKITLITGGKVREGSFGVVEQGGAFYFVTARHTLSACAEDPGQPDLIVAKLTGAKAQSLGVGKKHRLTDASRAICGKIAAQLTDKMVPKNAMGIVVSHLGRTIGAFVTNPMKQADAYVLAVVHAEYAGYSGAPVLLEDGTTLGVIIQSSWVPGNKCSHLLVQSLHATGAVHLRIAGQLEQVARPTHGKKTVGKKTPGPETTGVTNQTCVIKYPSPSFDSKCFVTGLFCESATVSVDGQDAVKLVSELLANKHGCGPIIVVPSLTIAANIEYYLRNAWKVRTVDSGNYFLDMMPNRDYVAIMVPATAWMILRRSQCAFQSRTLIMMGLDNMPVVRGVMSMAALGLFSTIVVGDVPKHWSFHLMTGRRQLSEADFETNEHGMADFAVVDQRLTIVRLCPQ
jgi:hypothetical protein